MLENLKDGKIKLTVVPTGLAKNFTFEEQKDKYLYTRNKTIGFRKDKKLSKFVGLRDGYSKQLELSIISVTIDGEEKIAKKRVNFNSISLEDGSLVHNISGTKFYNEVTNTNFMNSVEVDSPFDYMEILYEVHTKGLSISNRLSVNKYSIGDNRFIFVDSGNKETMFVIDIPHVTDTNGNKYNIVSHSLFIEGDKLYYKKILTKVTDKYNFPLYVDINITFDIDVNVPLNSGNTSGVGVISSSGDTWSTVRSGNLLQIEHSSSIGTFETAVGVSGTTEIPSGYTLSRTYLNFITSIFSGYTDILSSVRLNLHSYIFNDEGISVLQCTATGTTLTIDDWDKTGITYVSSSTIEKNDITSFELPFSVLNLDNNVDSGLTRFVLLSNHDIVTEPYDVESYTGIDFNGTYLEVIYEYLKVYGQTEWNVVKGDYFDLYAYTNSGYTELERNNNSNYIQWFRTTDFSGTTPIFIGSGFTQIYSMEYIDDNKLYAVLPIGIGWSVPLIISINVIQLNYSSLPVKNINYDEIDIDSIYFKYHKCISGVCYTYVRDINNIYEGFPLVSDSWGNQSYNLYNEFDIIDEFFSNSHEVEIAYDKNLDLTKRYNQIDGVIIHEGTRVLLMAQTNVTELGVYVAQYDNTLIRIDELNNYDDMFRYKAHVGAGTYFDQEIHIWPILPPPIDPFITLLPNPVVFDFESGYSQTVTVESNTNWKLYNLIPWISVNKSKGVGITELILTTTMTNLTLVPRIGNIEFAGYGGVNTILEVIQNNDLGLDYRILTLSEGGLGRNLVSGEPRTIKV